MTNKAAACGRKVSDSNGI